MIGHNLTNNTIFVNHIMLVCKDFMSTELNFNFNICCNGKYQFFNMEKTDMIIKYIKSIQIENVLNVENIIMLFSIASRFNCKSKNINIIIQVAIDTH